MMGQTRRGFLTRSAAFMGGMSRMAAAAKPVLAYVGTYSSPEGPEGSQGNGKGIYLFDMDPATGVLTERQVIPNDANPSWLALDRDRTHLYSANEAANGTVSAYTVNRST